MTILCHISDKEESSLEEMDLLPAILKFCTIILVFSLEICYF